MFFSIIAGSGFGSREAIYKLVEKVLVLRDEGDHDNLDGNSIACEFEGLTIEQAQKKIKAENSEGAGHNYDGCHACNWSISLRELERDQVPAHLTYNEPSANIQCVFCGWEGSKNDALVSIDDQKKLDCPECFRGL